MINERAARVRTVRPFLQTALPSHRLPLRKPQPQRRRRQRKRIQRPLIKGLDLLLGALRNADVEAQRDVRDGAAHLHVRQLPPGAGVHAALERPPRGLLAHPVLLAAAGHPALGHEVVGRHEVALVALDRPLRHVHVDVARQPGFGVDAQALGRRRASVARRDGRFEAERFSDDGVEEREGCVRGRVGLVGEAGVREVLRREEGIEVGLERSVVLGVEDKVVQQVGEGAGGGVAGGGRVSGDALLYFGEAEDCYLRAGNDDDARVFV